MMELQRPVLQLWLMIGLWWSGYFVANLGLMWDFAYKSAALLWCVEMAAIQNTLGSVALIFIAKLTGRTVWPIHRKKVIFLAALGHLMGNLAINAANILNKSGVSLILSICQPLFTFILTTRSISLLHFSQFSSIAVLLGGLVTFQMECSALFNGWGVAAAAISSLAFTGRNVLLKEGFNNLDNTLEKYVAVSSLSAAFSLPLWILKVALTGTTHTISLRGKGALSYYIVYPVYSFTSFKVLEMVTPVTHAIVSIFIRLYSSIDSLTPIDFPWNSFVGIFAFLVGVYLYYFQNQSTNKVWIALKFILLFFIAFLLVDERSDLPSNSIDPPIVLSIDCQSISTAWLYDRPITENIIANIGDLADNNPTMKVYVYCGTTQCDYEVAALEKENVVVRFAVMSEIVKGTPLEKWVAHHSINKFIAGQEFENHLHEVAILGILWRYGGYYVNPKVSTAYENLSRYHNGTSAVVSQEKMVAKGSLPSVLDVVCFSKYHPMLKRLAEVYVSKYPTINDDNPFKFDFMNAVWKTVVGGCIDPHRFDELSDSVTHLNDFTGPLHYGLLSHSAPEYPMDIPSQLIDGAIENFAALQYLPFVDSHVDRENLRSVGKGNVTVFLNGNWTISDGERLMATLKHLRPIMLSFHFDRTASWSKGAWGDFQSYLQKHEPIGFRDEDQSNSLVAKGVKAFSPSSLMLLLKNPSPGTPKNDAIYITDVEEEFMNLLLPNIPKVTVLLHNEHHSGSEGNKLTTFKAAYQLMKKFESAKLVVTQNYLHALACAAMETPVIFVVTKPRVAETLDLLFHTIDAYKMTKYQIKEWLGNFSWTNIPHNPNPAQLMRLRATSWNVIRRDQHLRDSAVKLGAVPMSPPVSIQHERKLVFYLVFSTSTRDTIDLIDSSSTVSGEFNWRNWRTVESIFYHHPTAEVKVYSNTLPDDTFSVLTEAGYSIEIHRYKLESLLVGTPAEGFLGKLKSARLGPYWYSNVANLLRMLLLYQHGGIYMDTDVVVVRPLNSLPINIAGVQDRNSPASGSVNCAFLYFQKGNRFLEACLKEFVRRYNGSIWGHNGPSILTGVYHASKWSEDVVHIVDYKYFYMYPWTEVKKCFTDVEGDSFDTQMKILETEAYAVHLNSKITGYEGVAGNSLKNGTICKRIFNSYCVLCDRIY